MYKKFLSFLAAFAVVVAGASIAPASWVTGYQPEVPAKLKN